MAAKAAATMIIGLWNLHKIKPLTSPLMQPKKA